MKKIFLIALVCLYCVSANAVEHTSGNWKFKLDADAMGGFLETRDDKPLFIDDWGVKTTALYSFDKDTRIGAVYSIDADAIDSDDWAHDAFVLFEDRNYGRAEFGLTHSIARKMGLGLPDVGYLRINDKSLLYKKLDLKRVLISDTTATTGHEALRLNMATRQTEYGQYGLSIAGGGDDYNYAIDLASKIKQSDGKLKRAYSFAVSYMDRPNGYEENSYSPIVNADWRGQIATGVNLQYNSFIWALSARLIYDKNPTIKTADGLVAGTGVSYDLLQYTLSLNYLFSDTNVWSHRDKITNEQMSGDYVHTTLASFRYKYSEHTSMFMSGGFADSTPFFSVGIKTGF